MPSGIMQKLCQEIKDTMSTKEKSEQKVRPSLVKKVLLRNGFYWAQYKNLLATVVISATTLLVGIGVLVYFITFDPPHKYIPTTTDFKVLVSPPLNEEFLGEGDVIQVATNALRSVYSYDYVNWEDQVTSSQKWFTTEGWNAFVSEFKTSGGVEAVVKNKQVVSIKIIEAPFIKEKGLVNGAHTWVVDFPRVQVTYYGQAGNKLSLTFLYSFKVEVTRTALDYSIKGAAVSAIRAKDVLTGQEPIKKAN